MVSVSGDTASARTANCKCQLLVLNNITLLLGLCLEPADAATSRRSYASYIATYLVTQCCKCL